MYCMPSSITQNLLYFTFMISRFLKCQYVKLNFRTLKLCTIYLIPIFMNCDRAWKWTLVLDYLLMLYTVQYQYSILQYQETHRFRFSMSGQWPTSDPYSGMQSVHMWSFWLTLQSTLYQKYELSLSCQPSVLYVSNMIVSTYLHHSSDTVSQCFSDSSLMHGEEQRWQERR